MLCSSWKPLLEVEDLPAEEVKQDVAIDDFSQILLLQLAVTLSRWKRRELRFRSAVHRQRLLKF